MGPLRLLLLSSAGPSQRGSTLQFLKGVLLFTFYVHQFNLHDHFVYALTHVVTDYIRAT